MEKAKTISIPRLDINLAEKLRPLWSKKNGMADDYYSSNTIIRLAVRRGLRSMLTEFKGE